MRIAHDEHQHYRVEYFEPAYENLKKALLDMQDVFSSRLHLNKNRNGYWLAGLDVIYDNKLRPWILEINGNPGMHPDWNTPERWDRFFVTAVRDMVDLAIVPLLNPKVKPRLGNWEYLFTQRDR